MSETTNTNASAIPVEIKDDALVAGLPVKLADEASLKALAHAVDEKAGDKSGITTVIVDLSRVQLLPSLALGLLVQLSNKCKARQQKLKLAAVTPQVRQVFAITRLDRIFDFAPSVEAALG